MEQGTEHNLLIKTDQPFNTRSTRMQSFQGKKIKIKNKMGARLEMEQKGKSKEEVAWSFESTLCLTGKPAQTRSCR